jgi:hypothetical protein
MILSTPAQMTDAGRFQEYGKARIGNATFISPENVLEEGRLKGGGAQGYLRPIERQPDGSGLLGRYLWGFCGVVCSAAHGDSMTGFISGRISRSEGVRGA